VTTIPTTIIIIRKKERPMSDPTRDQPSEAPLNPALKSSRETVYDTRHPTPPPIETASSREGEGEGWPIVWLIVTLACIVLGLYLLF
jgi:hypothetical protein